MIPAVRSSADQTRRAASGATASRCPSATPSAGAVMASSLPLGRHHRPDRHRSGGCPRGWWRSVPRPACVPAYFTLGMMLAQPPGWVPLASVGEG